MTRFLFAALHLLGLGIGLGAIWARAMALRWVTPLDRPAVGRVITADAYWGVAALVWIATGLVRWLSGLEKGTDWYLSQPVFHAKMGLFLVILLLEIKPMTTLGRWRRQLRQGEPVDTAVAPTLARISRFQALVVVVMVFVAAAMARGLGSK
jgi:putative membrane protein